MKMIIKESLRQ